MTCDQGKEKESYSYWGERPEEGEGVVVSSPEANSQWISQSGWKLKEVGRGERWGEGRRWNACQAFWASFQGSWAGSVGEPRGAAWGQRAWWGLCLLPFPQISLSIYLISACMHAQSFPTLCAPMGCNPRGSSVHGLFQARILEWVAISLSSRSSWPKDWTVISCSSCTGWQILYHWATGEAHFISSLD